MKKNAIFSLFFETFFKLMCYCIYRALQFYKEFFKIYIEPVNIEKKSTVFPILDSFDTISLKELNRLTPLKRFDSKFICHKSDLNYILGSLIDSYFILKIEDKLVFNYSNVYYDTPMNDFFNSHINGKLGRYKLRKRHYRDTDDVFIEIKYKNNRGETTKYRFRSLIEYRNPLVEHFDDISGHLPLIVKKLSPTVNIDYKRITLLKPGEFDKITIDFDLRLSTTDGGTIRLPNLLILEHKSIIKSGDKAIAQILKNTNYKKMSLSKYCLGLTLTKPGIKYNLYKPKLLTINKICNGINTEYSQFLWNNSFDGISG